MTSSTVPSTSFLAWTGASSSSSSPATAGSRTETPDRTPIETAQRVTDLALVWVYGGVALFFLSRYAAHRVSASLFIALAGPLGWATVAAIGLGVIEPYGWGRTMMAVVGVAVGCAMLNSLLRWEKKDPSGRPKG